MASLCGRLWHLLLLSSLVLSIRAQAPQDPLTDTCRRYGHQTAVIDRKLYVDGGWVYAVPISENPIPTISQGLLYGDLDQTDDGMPKQYANLTKNSSIPHVAGGTLWQDEVNKVFWLYGGEFSDAPSTFQLWGYDVILNQWNLSAATSSPSSPIRRVSYGAGVSVSESGQAFYYGGYLNSKTNPLWTGPPLATSNLIAFDMDENRMTNNTGFDSVGRAEGTMVFIPASAAGLLVYFGGVQFPHDNGTEIPMPLDTVLIYDIADAKWYSQSASGEVPGDRRKFCGGATWAKDQSSYQIYVYGGYGFGENITGFDDVCILSLPTFEWIKWYPDQPGDASPHGLLSCNVIDGTQMIVMGGNFTNKDICDVPAIGGQHNLNLGQDNVNDAKWYQYMPNLTEYSVPPAILEVTGGSAEGGATNKTPSNGWDDPSLSVYFGQRASFPQRLPTRVIPTPTASPAPPPPPPSTSNVAAIAGGAAGGGVALLVLVGLAVWFCLRRKKKRSRQEFQRPTLYPDVAEAPAYDHKHPSVSPTMMTPSSQPSSPFHPSAIVYRPAETAVGAHTYHPQHAVYQQSAPAYPFPVATSSGGNSPPPSRPQHHHDPVHDYLQGGGSAHQATTYYPPPPPPNTNRASPPFVMSHEMPTAKSPGMKEREHENVLQQPTPISIPSPTRPDHVRTPTTNIATNTVKT